MSYKVKTIDIFEKQAKKLFRKYVSLKSELLKLVLDLKENPVQGTPLGNNCFKIRIAISSKGKGKRGGARVITHIFISDDTVYMLSIYDKSGKDILTLNEIKELINSLSE